MSKKIVFMGTPEFAVPSLKELKNSDYEILTVYSQPASKANRGQKLTKSEIEITAERLSLNLRTPSSLDNDEEYNFLKSIKPEIVVVVAYGKIIPKRFLNLPKFGFINVHASLLPKWRGAAPMQRSIMNLDSETGITIMKIVEELDAGPVIHQDKIKINESVDTVSLSKLLSQLGAKSLIKAMNKIFKGDTSFKEQNHKEATYAKKISKEEAKINWNQSAKIVLAKINGLNPNPGAWFNYKNERYKIWKAKIINTSGNPGTTVDEMLTVACAEQSIKILEIQKEGKSRQQTDQFLLGNKIKIDESID
ncbi:MAG: methionyl-tRNA formyltransferase [Candidatus Pelagibacter sp. TMED196]|nr:MAG: methionyl-tRNA formyltransferase [Candidatus Pelagibacter sp. TMED196]